MVRRCVLPCFLCCVVGVGVGGIRVVVVGLGGGCVGVGGVVGVG